MTTVLKFCIFLCFFPFSVQTPVGFVTLADLSAAILLFVSIAYCVQHKKLETLNRSALLAITLCLGAIYVVQISAGIYDLATLLKFTEFMLIIPFSIALCYRSYASIRQRDLAYTVAWSSLVLLILTLISAFIWRKQGFEVRVLGAPINKNGLGSLLLFGSTAWLYLAMSHKRMCGLVYALYLATLLYIEARSAFLVSIAIVPIIYYVLKGAGRTALWSVSIVVFLAVFISILSSTPLWHYYFDRYASVFSFNTAQESVSSSSSRLILWQLAWSEFLDKPLLGWGIGGFSYDGPIVWLRHLEEPHNFIVQLLHNGGILIFSLFSILFYKIGRLAVKQPFFMIFFLGYFLNMMVSILFNRLEGHLFFIVASFVLFVTTSRRYIPEKVLHPSAPSSAKGP